MHNLVTCVDVVLIPTMKLSVEITLVQFFVKIIGRERMCIHRQHTLVYSKQVIGYRDVNVYDSAGSTYYVDVVPIPV